MSTQYQNYSPNNQTYVQQNVGYACAQARPQPQMVPMSSPMFQPMPVYYTAPSFPQLNCAFQGMTLTSAPVQQQQQATSPYLPLTLSSCGSYEAMASAPQCDFQMTPPIMPGTEYSLPSPNEFCIPPSGMVLGSMESYSSLQRSPSPAGLGHTYSPQPNMIPSYSPQPYPVGHYSPPQMISLVSAGSSPLSSTMGAPPQRMRSASSVTVTESLSSVTPPLKAPLPESLHANITPDPSLLGFREVSVPRSVSPDRNRSVSRARSVSDYSVDASEITDDREQSTETTSNEPSKRDLVNRAFARLQAMFGDNFDQNGNRGNNILRLKVKTRNALEQIVPLIEFCQQENLIKSISCPISTKKGRQQVRGFLAYLEMKNESDADRVEQLIQDYNAKNASPFNTWHRNPPSTWGNRV